MTAINSISLARATSALQVLQSAAEASGDSSTNPAKSTSGNAGVTASGISVSKTNTATAIQAILAHAQLANAPLTTLGGAGGADNTTTLYQAQTVSSSTMVRADSAAAGGGPSYTTFSKLDTAETLSTAGAATTGNSPSASTASALSTTTQGIFDTINAIAINAVAAGGLVVAGQADNINFSTLSLSTITKTDTGTARETASIAAGTWDDSSTAAYLQSMTEGTAQGAASSSQEHQSSAAASTTSSESPSSTVPVGSSGDGGSTPNAQSVLRLTIYAGSDAGFTLGEAQAKQLVSAYENYLSSSGDTSGAGFSFAETYQTGSIEIDGVAMATPNQDGLSSTIQRQQSSDSGWEAFMIPLSTSSSAAS